MNYSKEDLKRIFTIYSNGLLYKANSSFYPELNDIDWMLNICFSRTAFFSSVIDDETSYKTINYVINLLKSIDKEQLKLIDYHMMESITYPFSSNNNHLINKLNAVFRPKEVTDNATYVINFLKFFEQLSAVNAAQVNIGRYRNLDVLVKMANNYMIGTSKKRECYSLLQIAVAYIYKNIDNFNEEVILNIFDSLFKDEYYLSKIRLNSSFRFGEVIYDNILRWHNKEDINCTYDYISYIIEQILDNKELDNVKKVIR